MTKEVDEIMSGAIARTEADDILEQGREEQIDNVVALFNFLYANGRVQDIQKAATDSKLLKKMIKDFSNGKLKEKNN